MQAHERKRIVDDGVELLVRAADADDALWSERATGPCDTLRVAKLWTPRTGVEPASPRADLGVMPLDQRGLRNPRRGAALCPGKRPPIRLSESEDPMPVGSALTLFTRLRAEEAARLDCAGCGRTHGEPGCDA